MKKLLFRFIAIILTFTLIVGFSGCGEKYPIECLVYFYHPKDDTYRNDMRKVYLPYTGEKQYVQYAIVSDETKEIVEFYHTARITYEYSPENAPSQSLNYMLERGKYAIKIEILNYDKAKYYFISFDTTVTYIIE